MDNFCAEICVLGDKSLRKVIFSFLRDPPPPNYDFGEKWADLQAYYYGDNLVKNILRYRNPMIHKMIKDPNYCAWIYKPNLYGYDIDPPTPSKVIRKYILNQKL